MAGPTAGGFLVGVFGLLLGIAAIVAAFRRRRGRARYMETYAAAGGGFYTAVQVGCGAVLGLGGLLLMVVALIFR